MESIPPEALSELQAVQIATMEGLEGLTEEQFAEIPVATFKGLTEHNMADFTIQVINKFTPPLLADKSSEQVSLPTIANIELGVGVGGLGNSIESEMENTLEEEDLTDFVLSQEDSGILKVEGIGDEKGKQYAFIPDADDAIQVDTDEIPIGLSVGLGGFYNITTPEGQQFKVIPAPKNPIALVETTGSKVNLGKRGDVLMHPSSRTRSSESYEVLMFDPFVEPSMDDLCIEIFPCEFECDDENLRRSSRAETRR